MSQPKKQEYVQTFGKRKTATATAICRQGKGTLKVNGVPIDLIQPEIMKMKVLEPLLLLGYDQFAKYDIRIKVRGGGHISQLYAIRIALSKAIVAFN